MPLGPKNGKLIYFITSLKYHAPHTQDIEVKTGEVTD